MTGIRGPCFRPQTDPTTGACLAAPAFSTTTPFAASTTQSYAIFVDARFRPDDPVLRAWESGQSAAEAVPFLLRALRLPDWTVRRAADLVLREMSGKSFGEQEPWTTESDVTRMAAAWEDHWSRTSPER